jgi:hypothetical protein
MGNRTSDRVTEYLERARQCAALADKMSEPDKATLMEIVGAWLTLADEAEKGDSAQLAAARAVKTLVARFK